MRVETNAFIEGKAHHCYILIGRELIRIESDKATTRCGLELMKLVNWELIVNSSNQNVILEVGEVLWSGPEVSSLAYSVIFESDYFPMVKEEKILVVVVCDD